MHASTLLISLSAFLTTSVTATPAPLEVPLAYPELVSNDLAASLSLTARASMTADDGALSGDLPENVAKVWAFTQGRCNVDDGPFYMWTALPNTNRCYQVKNVGSVFAWTKNNKGQGRCTITIHSGSDCRGVMWMPNNKKCASQLYASIYVTCPDNNSDRGLS